MRLVGTHNEIGHKRANEELREPWHSQAKRPLMLATRKRWRRATSCPPKHRSNSSAN